MSNVEQVFVLGAPRSGTTFLASLLEHTRFKAPFETHFITKYYKRLNSYGDINQLSNFSKLLADILSERAVMQWKLDINPEALFSQFNGSVTFPALVDKLCLMQDPDKSTNCWGDKTPHYLMDLELVYELFPNAKYVYIVRDGRDVALSLLEKEWGPNNVYTCAEYWRELNRDRPLLKEMLDKGQLIQLHYEDLLDNTEGFIRQVYEFLGEPCDESVVKTLASTTKKGNYHKWKTRLSERQKKVFDNVAGETLAKYGYETLGSNGNTGGLARLLYKAHDKLIWLLFMFKTNVIDGIKIKFFGKDPFAD
ncbi:sulfotransferase [Pseudomonadota bacterium]